MRRPYKLAMAVMVPSLTATGVFWVCLSLASAVLSSAGFYLPFWIKGTLFNNTEASFGSFRRCNYPRLNEAGKFEVVLECGRYTSFTDIPSWGWQFATISVGVGASLALLVSFTVLASCCVSDVVTRYSSRVLGAVQMVAGLLIVCGVAAYPQGWESLEVRQVCGEQSKAYRIGTCEISWSIYILGCSVGLLALCCCLSFRASKIEPHSYRI